MIRRLVLLLALSAATAARADELSGADKLRLVYSNQFAWTKDGLPLVTVRIAEHRAQVTVSAADGGVRLLPDGDGGAAIAGGRRWTLRVDGGRPAVVRWHAAVARLGAADGERVQAELAAWRARGLAPRTFEVGAVFGVHGEVVDSRRILVAVGRYDDEAAARAEALKLAAQYHVETSVHAELAERPRGSLVATDERGTVVRNDALLWFAPESGELLEVDDIEKEGKGRDNRRYAGRIYVTLDNAGTLAVVNAVPEDRLLAGLVPAEMSASSPPEALKAQAVAARNELLAKLGTRHLTDPYRLCSTQHCQVYAGAGHEDPRATAAVKATRGELLERDGGGLVDAVYSASCGGHTEDNERVWGSAADPSLRGRLDADEATAAAWSRFARVDDVAAFLAAGDEQPVAARPWCARPRGAQASWRWTASVDVAAVAARTAVGPLRTVEVVERGVSGRIARLRLVGDQGEREIRGELEVRRALGGLKSALAELEVKRDAGGHVTALVARGAGHGHGIGMCQLGAVGLAEAGATYVEILRHYYAASHLRKLY